MAALEFGLKVRVIFHLRNSYHLWFDKRAVVPVGDEEVLTLSMCEMDLSELLFSLTIVLLVISKVQDFFSTFFGEDNQASQLSQPDITPII